MKRYTAVFLSAVTAISLAGCGNTPANTPDATASGEPENYMSDIKAADIKLKDTKNLVESTVYQPQSLDYVISALAEDSEYTANFVDGLLENDKYGNLAPSIATSYSLSEDGLTYTFHIRPDVKWVDNTGEVYDTVTAQDFVTGLRHSAEFNSAAAQLADGVVEGYSEYRTTADWSDAAWEKVGVKAVDELTLVYTLEKPTPYFPSLVTYSLFNPINQDFLESKGEGCKLGAPDTTNCSFGAPVPDGILYNGGFILESNDDKSSNVWKKNENYWDKDNIKLDSVTRIFDDGSDPYSDIRNFEAGVYFAGRLSTQWENFDEYMKKYDGYAAQSMPNSACFGIVFNYNRQTFDNTNYATDSALAENTHNAIMNENFRKAIRSAWDREKYLMVFTPKEQADSMLRNINNDPEIVRTSDGTAYGKLVEEAYTDRTGTEVNLADGQNPWLSKEDALKYIEEAKKDGIEFPVHLDMLVIETNKRLVDQAQSLKKSIEDNTDGNIIVELVMRDEDTVKNIAYYSSTPEEADYDISTFTGWSPDYADPKSFVDIYSPTSGYYMTSCGLTTKDNENFGTDDDIKRAVGFMEYEELYRAADEIYADLDERYAAFAKADAQLIDKCFFIPSQMQGRAIRVTHEVPFSKITSKTGTSDVKYKGRELQEDIVTTAAYEAAMADYQTGGTAPKITD